MCGVTPLAVNGGVASDSCLLRASDTRIGHTTGCWLLPAGPDGGRACAGACCSHCQGQPTGCAGAFAVQGRRRHALWHGESGAPCSDPGGSVQSLGATVRAVKCVCSYLPSALNTSMHCARTGPAASHAATVRLLCCVLLCHCVCVCVCCGTTDHGGVPGCALLGVCAAASRGLAGAASSSRRVQQAGVCGMHAVHQHPVAGATAVPRTQKGVQARRLPFHPCGLLRRLRWTSSDTRLRHVDHIILHDKDCAVLPKPQLGFCQTLQNRWRKRGLAVTPTKFGIAFTKLTYNQGGALVHVYTDGTVRRAD